MSYSSSATGILLAAGYGSRFDPSGLHNKLLATLPDGTPVVFQSARRLLSAVSRVVAVVRPGSEKLAEVLNEAGCDVMFSIDAERGMGATLAAAVRATHDAEGWLVTLGDMPWIKSQTMEAVARSLDGGASIVAPFYRGQRGHPAGFSAMHLETLSALDGDAGARTLFMSEAVERIDVDDANILRDVDSPEDLQLH
ncbi:molybdopterin-guanine dinucleotide biosynthesis protein MobA [Caballeronia mineralivorans PML1(12)]|uniref:Molybdopterin-guanine dinucleotide biosynthesis protein MobA n=1 Tax=Caballeronia mineralivorans PML1(12) TaxID=908627 RepID=A0A0J1CYZ1_9BURK|nr:nucleotidyltransferase family protein [Caballeronia mineralivorans]KLU25749.1 molybdopterin-guanine dinucleotide biosynthesis protein MobA [Caballeronia mineralivorans PML1(12)]